MEVVSSLSKREKRFHFIYLLLILLFSIILLGIIFLRKFDSPFSANNTLETQILEQQNRFIEQQKLVEPYLENSYKKISLMQQDIPQPFAENDIKNSINDIANSFQKTTIYDSRKEGYVQIAEFYKMYFEDKKIIAKKLENIVLFEKQFQECSIGFNEREQQLSNKKNAILSRSTQ